MLSKTEIICKAIKEFGESIKEIKIKGDKILFAENEYGKLFTSKFEDLFDESVNISYSGDTLSTVIVDLAPKKLDIDDVFEKIMTGYSKCKYLISLSKEKNKIIIIVERFRGWGKNSVVNMIGNDYNITEYENSDGDWEIIISLEDDFDICNATLSEIENRLRGHYDVFYVVGDPDNDTIMCVFKGQCNRTDVCGILNLPLDVGNWYTLADDKYLFLNLEDVRGMYE